MKYKLLVKKIINKQILIEDLLKIKILYEDKISYGIDDFIKKYQHCINSNEDEILILFQALNNLGFNFTEDHFTHHLIHGLYDKVTEWYINSNAKFRKNEFLIYAAMGTQGARCYGFPLKCLLTNGFAPNFESIDLFWYHGFNDGSKNCCIECYELLLNYGYKFSNPLVVCDILSYISFLIIPEPPLNSYEININLLYHKEIIKYFNMDFIEIKEEHIQKFIELKYYSKRENIFDDVINNLCWKKNKFFKWPNVIININDYTRTNNIDTKIYKYPKIGFDDNFIQSEYLE